MSLFARLLQSVRTTRRPRPQLSRARQRTRLALEALEDRCVPTTALTAITSNFNGTAIPAGDTLWFSSVFKASGVPSTGATIQFSGQQVTFTANGTPYTVAVPDSTVTFSPSTTQATNTFSSGAWSTSLPMSFSGNGFLSGAALQVPGGLPGGINPVKWQGNMVSDTAGVTVKWQWAAAVYTNFSSNYSTLSVKPVDDPNASTIANSDHAGTPEAFKSFVIGGARGGGGSNFTGSYSATASVAVPVGTIGTPSAPATTATLSGNISGPGGVTVTLSGTTATGQTLVYTTTTDASGNYLFTNVQPGTYTLSETPPTGYVENGTSLGTVNGTAAGTTDNTSITLTLQAGDNGINYNFLNGLPS